MKNIRLTHLQTKRVGYNHSSTLMSLNWCLCDDSFRTGVELMKVVHRLFFLPIERVLTDDRKVLFQMCNILCIRDEKRCVANAGAQTRCWITLSSILPIQSSSSLSHLHACFCYRQWHCHDVPLSWGLQQHALSFSRHWIGSLRLKRWFPNIFPSKVTRLNIFMTSRSIQVEALSSISSALVVIFSSFVVKTHYPHTKIVCFWQCTSHHFLSTVEILKENDDWIIRTSSQLLSREFLKLSNSKMSFVSLAGNNVVKNIYIAFWSDLRTMHDVHLPSSLSTHVFEHFHLVRGTCISQNRSSSWWVLGKLQEMVNTRKYWF